tara:strand:- start:134 stop:394 length:261 start_codon:yes stop_codon:yes gene_type:complete
MKKFFEYEAKVIAEDLATTCNNIDEALSLVEQNVNEMWADANWSEDDKSSYIAMTGIEPERVGMTVDGVAKMFLGMEVVEEINKVM